MNEFAQVVGYLTLAVLMVVILVAVFGKHDGSRISEWTHTDDDE